MYDIPGFKDFKITEDLKVYNIKTDNVLQGSINGAGYRFYHIHDDSGKERNLGEHRLIALAVHGKPEEDDLVVNHKNGLKLDNSPDNLEWLSFRDNLIHAGESGLSSKAKSVQVRNVKTKEVLTFRTFIDCAKHFGVSKDIISHRCRYNQLLIHPDGLQYRSPASNDEWLEIDDINLLLLGVAIIVRDIESGEERNFATYTEASKYLKISLPSITAHFKKSAQPVVRGRYQLKKSSDKNDWLPPIDLRKNQKVKVVDVRTGKTTIYETALEAAKSNGLKATTLNYRLSSEGKNIFSDGKTYQRIQRTVL